MIMCSRSSAQQGWCPPRARWPTACRKSHAAFRGSGPLHRGRIGAIATTWRAHAPMAPRCRRARPRCDGSMRGGLPPERRMLGRSALPELPGRGHDLVVGREAVDAGQTVPLALHVGPCDDAISIHEELPGELRLMALK